jgi:hypothetical protein
VCVRACAELRPRWAVARTSRRYDRGGRWPSRQSRTRTDNYSGTLGKYAASQRSDRVLLPESLRSGMDLTLYKQRRSGVWVTPPPLSAEARSPVAMDGCAPGGSRQSRRRMTSRVSPPLTRWTSSDERTHRPLAPSHNSSRALPPRARNRQCLALWPSVAPRSLRERRCPAVIQRVGSRFRAGSAKRVDPDRQSIPLFNSYCYCGNRGVTSDHMRGWP